MVRLVCAALLLATLIFGLTAIQSGTVGAEAAKKQAKHRVGGKVKKARPRAGNPPSRLLAKWLARQVGPVRPCGRKWTRGPRAERRRHNRNVRRCKRWHRRIKVSSSQTPMPATVSAAADPGAPAYASRRVTPSLTATTADPVLLARSYQIPKDDPDYERLVNWSYTYDSAVTASAFIALDEKAQAQQILDQLSALQFNTGAIDIAFDVTTGAGAGLYRSGNVAWLGLAATTFDQRNKTSRYLQTVRRSADFLLGLQASNGLVKGGPNVSWMSTLHNLIAYAFLARAAREDPVNTVRYSTAATRILNAIDSNLLVDDKNGLRYLQGLNDPVDALDTQAIGAIHLAGRNRFLSAAEVLDGVTDRFAVKNQKILLNNSEKKYNQTWSSKEFFSGFKPYASTKVPQVIWFEGTAEVRAATAVNFRSTATLDAESKKWREVTEKGGSSAPLQANETILEGRDELDVEYHVWPAAAATAWQLLSTNEPRFLIP